MSLFIEPPLIRISYIRNGETIAFLISVNLIIAKQGLCFGYCHGKMKIHTFATKAMLAMPSQHCFLYKYFSTTYLDYFK